MDWVTDFVQMAEANLSPPKRCQGLARQPTGQRSKEASSAESLLHEFFWIQTGLFEDTVWWYRSQFSSSGPVARTKGRNRDRIFSVEFPTGQMNVQTLNTKCMG